MRDGTILRGNLYRPAAVGRYPVVLLRSVFRKDDMGRAFSQYDPAVFVRAGYVVYIQDVRGLGSSDGEFDRFTADGKDGYDTIEQLAAKDWCNGKVGMIGSYFAGYLQLMAAAENPPHLRAIAPMQTSVSINRDCNNRGFMFFSHIGWCMSRLCNRLIDGRYDEKTTSEWLPRLRSWILDYPTTQLSVWPARDMPVLQDTPFPLIQDYFRHLVEGFDDFDLLHKEGRDMDLSVVRTPAFFIAGWYDSSRTPLIEHCLVQRSHGVNSRVLIAPWQPGEQPAMADSALERGVQAVSLQDELLRWFDHWLKEKSLPVEAPIRYYDIRTGSVLGTNLWPPKDIVKRSFFLGKDHTLLSNPSDQEGQASYEHYPKQPLYYYGYGKIKSDELKEDPRVLDFISNPVEQALKLCGMPHAEITFSSTARDADLFISLCDVCPEGNIFIISDGGTRARFRNSWTSEPLDPNKKVQFSVLLGNVHYTLPAGHRLMIRMMGSAFPKYDVNHGTASRPADDAEWVNSTQTVWFGKAHPSAVVLPIL